MPSATPTSPDPANFNHLVISDQLTGRPNRCLFLDRLQQAMKRSCRDQNMLGVLYIDIDYFQQINESHGREVGDFVLRAFADQLAASIRATDTVARLWEDDFVVLMEDLHSIDDAKTVVAKILANVRQPIQMNGLTLNVTTSIGVAVYAGEEKQDASYLLNLADQALYRAKNNGRNQVSY